MDNISVFSYFSVMYDKTIFSYFTYKVVTHKSFMPGKQTFVVVCWELPRLDQETANIKDPKEVANFLSR